MAQAHILLMRISGAEMCASTSPINKRRKSKGEKAPSASVGKAVTERGTAKASVKKIQAAKVAERPK